MNRPLRIAIADDESEVREFFTSCVGGMGHDVVATAQTGRELVELCHAQRPDLVITDIKMPDMDGIEAAQHLGRAEPIPVILVTAYDDPALLHRAGDNHVLGYLVKPIKFQDLQPAITIAIRRFEEFQALTKEASDLRQALKDRKIIERAKGILMKRADLDEATAFQRLQKMARDNNRKLVHIAEMIVTVEDAYEPGQK